MSPHKAPSIADLARATAQSRHIVCSVGSLDGPFLLALQRLQTVPAAGSDVSTLAPGVTQDGEKPADTACQKRD